MSKVGARLSVGFALATTLLSGSAYADEVKATGKGIAGGALLGTELAVVTEAIVGVKSPWLYASGIALAGGGGGVGGYYVEKADNVGLSMTMLFAGMALLIPTAIVYLDATGDNGETEYEDELPPEAAPNPDAMPEATGPQYGSMIELDRDALSMRLLPPLQVREVYTPEELDNFGGAQRLEFEFSLFGGRF